MSQTCIKRLVIALVLVLATGSVASGGYGPVSSAAQVSPRTLTFTNPVYRRNFPDPFILRVGHTYYAYATGTCSRNLQVMHSTDLVHWSSVRDPLPRVPSWAQSSCNSFFENRAIWAPEVLRRSNGTYVLYYVIHGAFQYSQCVSEAASSSPEGPFVDSSKGPLVCQTTLGGSIDPDPFRDSDGTLYLLWKNDGNSQGMPTYLWSQRLSASGARLVGKPSKLLRNDASWEGPLIEAPTMWKQAGKYYVFFSANGFNTSQYATGFATCRGPSGPCKDAPENPILKTRCQAAGPGGQALFVDAKGQTWIAYHAWLPNHIGDLPGSPGRLLWLDRLLWKNGKPVVHGPTCTAQTAPAT